MILCCGEALIDMIVQEGLPDLYKACPGGAALNSAIALARLDVPVALVAGVSLDPFGEQLVAEMQRNRVATPFLIRSGRPTTLAFAHVRNGNARYSFFDAGSAGRMLHSEQMPEPDETVEALLFGGISLAGEPCGTAFETLLGNSADTHLVMTDPNIRPALIEDERQYRERLDRVFALSDIVKLSEEDLEWLGSETLSKLSETGTSLVLITRGERGAAAVAQSGMRTDVPGQRVEVVDTVGAGDIFNAAFLSALRQTGCLSKAAVRQLQQDVLINSLGFACEAAALSVTRTGADSPWNHELS